MSVHRAIEIWQERPGEFSFKCACGWFNKHQKFGPVTCGGEIWQDDQLGLISKSGTCTICRHEHGTATHVDEHPCVDCETCDCRREAKP